jgi:sterol desaturase/sphingolipid hydroxylase (fatty acid hydroxylase superfamily)
MGNMAWFFTPGFEIGYLVYSLMHYCIHTKVKLPFMDFMSFHHNLHHYREPEKAFGVSSRFWDRIFRTMP